MQNIYNFHTALQVFKSCFVLICKQAIDCHIIQGFTHIIYHVQSIINKDCLIVIPVRFLILLTSTAIVSQAIIYISQSDRVLFPHNLHRFIIIVIRHLIQTIQGGKHNIFPVCDQKQIFIFQLFSNFYPLIKMNQAVFKLFISAQQSGIIIIGKNVGIRQMVFVPVFFRLFHKDW